MSLLRPPSSSPVAVPKRQPIDLFATPSSTRADKTPSPLLSNEEALEKRVRALENQVADLQAQIELMQIKTRTNF